MKKERSTLKLGLFVTIGVILLAITVYSMGKQQNIFGKTITAHAIFKDVKGLQVGNNVQFSGINVGSVTDIEILMDAEVKVTFVIRKHVKKFLKRDAKATIKTEGLMGSNVLSLIPGTKNKQIIKEGHIFETIPPIEIDDILTELNEASKNTTQVTYNLSEITNKINMGKGIFGKLFTDTLFTNNLENISKNTSVLTYNVAQITRKINNQEGLLGRLLADTAWAKEFDTTSKQIKETGMHFAEISKNINKGKGIFGKLFIDTNLINNIAQTGENLKILTTNLNAITEKINQGEGFMNTILMDTTLADSMKQSIENINYGAKELGRASEAIRNTWLIKNTQKK
ncbi:MAG: MlaD family protein [Bacteroidota bacterium]